MRVKFWGTRGSIPTPGPLTRRYGGNTACVEVRVGETLIICDGGSGMRALGMELMRAAAGTGAPVRAHLLFSHMHWDHIQGFPFFAPAYVPGSELKIYDIGASRGRFHALLSGQMQSEYFPVRFSDLKAELIPECIASKDWMIGDVRVTAFSGLKHPGGCIAYAFEAGGAGGGGAGAKVVYATDNELDLLLAGGGRNGASRREAEAGFAELIRGADLLIADGQYTEEEYPGKAGWGHASVRTATDVAAAAGVKRLALFHHDPMRTDEALDAMVASCTARAKELGSGLAVFAAREGMELVEGDWADAGAT